MKKAEDFRKAFGPATPGFETVVKKTIKDLRAQEVKPAVKEWRRWRRPVFAMAMALVLFVGFVAINGALNPFSRTDRIRSEEEGLYTAQPITTVLSMGAGQEEGDGEGTESVLTEEESIRIRLDEEAPGMSAKLFPVNQAYENQGLRVEVVSGYMSGTECCFVISVQDLEGQYTDYEAYPWFECDMAGFSGYSTSVLYENEAEHKTVYMYMPNLSNPVPTEDRTIKVGIETYHMSRDTVVDLLPMLEQYGKDVKTAEQPKRIQLSGLANKFPAKDMKFLDYTQPLDIPLLGDVCLSGIGWIDGQLHVQYHYKGEPTYKGGSVAFSDTWNVWEYSSADDPDYSPVQWDANLDGYAEWKEFIYDIKPEEADDLVLEASVSIMEKVLDGGWIIEFPLKTVCPDVLEMDPEIEERLNGFMDGWSTQDYDGMLTLCDPEWQANTEDARQALEDLTQSATLLENRYKKITGTAEDTLRTVTCATNIQRPGNKLHTSFQLDIEVKKAADGLWYINPESLRIWTVTEDIRVEPVETGPIEELDEDFGNMNLDEREEKLVFDAYAQAKVYTKDSIGYVLKEDGTAESVKTSTCMPFRDEIIIPERVRDYIVTAIGTRTFDGYDVKSLTLPDTVKTISKGAFSDCTNLVYFRIPDGVSSIEDEVFYDCVSMTDVIIPDSVTEIGSEAFYNCRSLTAAGIPERTVSIGSYAFLGCDGLTSITLPDTLEILGAYTFSRCNGLESVEIPGGVTSVEKGSFKDCTGLKAVRLKEGIAEIGEDAFSGCGALETVELPASLLTIGDRAFRECGSMKQLVLPDGLTFIGRAAFMNCTGLEEIVIPESVTTIELHAFRGCINLTCVVKDGSYAKDYCEGNGIPYVVK